MGARLLVSERHAAEMLDLPVHDFRDLVAKGALPAPTRLGKFERWQVSRLEAIANGKAALPSHGDFEV